MKMLHTHLMNWTAKLHVALWLGFASMMSRAQSNSGGPLLPTIGPAGTVDANTDPGSLAVTVFKWAGGIVIWLAVAWFGLLMFGSVIKAANEARGGDSSWAEAGKSMLGNVLMFVFFLTVALWYTAAFLT